MARRYAGTGCTGDRPHTAIGIARHRHETAEQPGSVLGSLAGTADGKVGIGALHPLEHS